MLHIRLVYVLIQNVHMWELFAQNCLFAKRNKKF